MAGNIKGIIVEIGGDTTSLQKALSKVNSVSSKLDKELRGINKLLKFDPKNTEMVSQKQQVLKENIAKVTEKLKALNSVQDQAQKKWENYKKVETQLNDLKTKIEETSKTLENLRKKQEKATEAFENGKISKEQYDNINKSVDDCINTLKELEKEQRELSKDTISTEKYREYQRDVASAKNQLEKLNKAQKDFMLEQSGWTTAGKKLEEYGSKIERIGSKLDNVGNKFTSIFTTSVIGLGVASGKLAVDFETAFTGVEKTVDGTKEQMAELKQGIVDMSKELPSTTTEISGVAEAAGQLGIQTDNVLNFTKTMIDMGNSTNLSADEAATSLARFANITGMSQKDFDKLGSSIVDLGNNFATTEVEIVEMSLRLAGAGAQVGMSEGQILGLATALSSVGIEAEMGGSALSKTMVKMQSAVEVSGSRLTNVLNKTEMSLRDLEMLAANNSKDFKELCNSIDMTSTEVKQLITAGTNLEDFSKIAGMSAEEFKNAWGKDATGALTAFIKGLGDAETKGDSAITLLNDMGLTEVRLRDSLLRAANAGDLFNNAIATGTKAWKDNTALANEANKRYGTTESKLKTTTNRLKNMGVTLGNRLLPIVDKWLTKADKWIDRLDNMDDATVDNIIKIGLLVASMGPAIKIISNLTTVISTSTKGIGIFTQAIGVLKTGGVSASASVNNLAKCLGLISNPAVLATTAITATTAAVIYFATKETEAEKSIREFAEKMADAKTEMNDYNAKIDSATNANLSHLDSTAKLKDELINLVDENGKVKQGYETRVSFILNELNKALDTEYELNGNVIGSYKDLQKEIDNLIAKKRAEIKLNADEEKYKDALDKQEQALDDLRTSYTSLTEKQKEYGTDLEGLKAKAKSFYDMSNNQWITGGNKVAIDMYKKQGDAIQNVINSYNDAEYRVQTYTNQVETYEKNYSEFVKGNYEAISNTITTTTSNWCDASIQEINNSITEQSKNLEAYRKIYEETGNKIAKERMEQAEKSLQSLSEELNSRTNTINNLSADEVIAWGNLAQNSRREYNDITSKMPQDMQDKINLITDVVSKDMTIKNAVNYLGKDVKEEFDLTTELEDIAIKDLSSFLNGLSDEEKRELLKQIGIENVDIVLDELNRGDLSEENGKNILQGLINGLNNNSLTSKIISTASNIVSSVNNAFTGIDGWDIHSPSRKMRKFAEYYLQPIPDVMNARRAKLVKTASNLAKNINTSFNKNLNLEDYSNLHSSINRKVVENTRNIFTTPKITFNVNELDEAKLQQCFNYINRKFGSSY